MSATNNLQTRTARPLTAVVGFDFSSADGPAFDQAIRIAQRAAHGEVHLVHVFANEPSPERLRDLADHLRLYVYEKAPQLDGFSTVRVGIHLRTGDVAQEIARLAGEVDADLIVLGSRRGPLMRHWIVGSTVHKLQSNGSRPVLVANPWPKEPADAHLIVIEPPCPDCVRARAESDGARWWCERHSHRMNAAHTYSYQFEMPFSSHDSVVSSTGIDF